jgi:hypothetical protein
MYFGGLKIYPFSTDKSLIVHTCKAFYGCLVVNHALSHGDKSKGLGITQVKGAIMNMYMGNPGSEEG